MDAHLVVGGLSTYTFCQCAFDFWYWILDLMIIPKHFLAQKACLRCTNNVVFL
jgi:hypothetical protein